MTSHDQTSFENGRELLQSDPKLRKCWVSLKRINVSEEKMRVKVENKKSKKCPCEPLPVTTFLKATPKKIIAIKGIGRVTLPKKTRLISKIDTPKGPLIVIDRKRPDIKLERLSFPRMVIDDTVQYYKDHPQENEVKEEPVCASQSTSNSPSPEKTIESQSPKPSTSEETQVLPINKVEVAPPPKVSLGKTLKKRTPKTVPKKVTKKAKTTTLLKRLDPRERQLIDLASFIDGHWFAGFHKGPLDMEENLRNAFRLQMSLISLQKQQTAPQNVPAAPAKSMPPFFTRQPMEERHPPKDKENSAASNCQEPQNSVNEGAGSSNPHEQTIGENNLSSSSSQGASSENGAKNGPVTVVKVRAFMEKEGNKFVKKVACPMCEEHIRIDVLRFHMETNHKTIPTSIGEMSPQATPASSNLSTDKIPPGCVRCKQCKKIMGMNDVLAHSCFNGRQIPDYFGPGVHQNTVSSQIRVAPKCTLPQNNPRPRGPILAACSNCKAMMPFADMNLHVCSPNASQGAKQLASSAASKLNGAYPVSQSQSAFSQELVKCRNCQKVIPKNTQSGHICIQLPGSKAAGPNVLFKCSKCNNGKLYSSLALKEHNSEVHNNGM